MDASPSSAEDEMNSCDTFTLNDWRQEQTQDKAIGRVIDIMRSGLRPRGESVKREPLQVQKLLRVYKKLELIEGILYKTSSHNGQKTKQIV